MDDKHAQALADLIQEYEVTRESYRSLVNRGDNNKGALLEFQGRFVDLKASLRIYHTYFTNSWQKFDDKSATAIKFRIAVAISEDRYVDEDDPIKYEKCSITAAEKYASGSRRYREFVEKRAFYRESLTNISDLRDDINSYINEIKDRLK